VWVGVACAERIKKTLERWSGEVRRKLIEQQRRLEQYTLTRRKGEHETQKTCWGGKDNIAKGNIDRQERQKLGGEIIIRIIPRPGGKGAVYDIAVLIRGRIPSTIINHVDVSVIVAFPKRGMIVVGSSSRTADHVVIRRII
jgi:hypothetical protein